MASPDFSGKYNLVRNENFEDFLAENGVPWMARKMAGMASPQLEVTQQSDSYNFKLISRVSTNECAFTLGQDFEEKKPNDIIVKGSPSLEEGKLVLRYTPLDQFKDQVKPQTHIRELDGNTLTLTLKVGNVVAKRIFERATS